MGNLTEARKKLVRSVLVCPDCKCDYIVYRKQKKKRVYEEGHIKDLWCFKCREDKKFIQLSSFEAKYNY